MTYTAEAIKKDLMKLSDIDKAKQLMRFFKTGKGEYGEGDLFIGITVPEQRKIATLYTATELAEIVKLLNDPAHECRLTALLILTLKYKKADQAMKKRIIKLYLDNTDHINNWDLVDLSSPRIIGDYCYNNGSDILYRLVKSSNMWEQRIAVVATYHFIKQNNFTEIIAFSEMLLEHKHDLIHKATGWMLREAGKMNPTVLTDFLDRHHKVMPRTMLRYSIEKLNETDRKKYMAK